MEKYGKRDFFAMLNKLMKVLLVAGVIFLLAVSSIPSDAREPVSYAVSSIGEEYTLSAYKNGEEYELLRAGSITELFASDLIENGAAVVFRGTDIREDFTVKNKTFTLTGSAVFSDCDFIVDGADLSFSSLNLKFSSSGGVRLKSGNLKLSDSEIEADKDSCIRLDYSSGATLVSENSIISSNSQSGTLSVLYGSLYIKGGEIKNTKAAAVVNEGSLYLSDNVSFSAAGFDVETDTPINLSFDGSEFSGKVKIKYEAEFQSGTITSVIYNATEESLKNVRLFDLNGSEAELVYFESSEYIKERSFAAVYKPYKASFLVGGILEKEVYFLKNEKITQPETPEKKGYKFIAWENLNGSSFDFSKTYENDLVLCAKYELLPPEFSISSLEFTYDGQEHTLGFSNLSHPLFESGKISYLWYKGEECVSSSNSVKVRGVSDSGKYICKLKFTHNGNEAEVSTEEITVSVKKAEIPLPEIKSKEYTGNILYPEKISSIYYEVTSEGGVNAGTYPVILKLSDTENYKFSGTKEESVSLDFVITPAKNTWTSSLKVENAYFGTSLIYSAKSKFGEVEFLFSSSLDGPFLNTVPYEVGTYYIKAAVIESENYESLESEALQFSVLPEKIVGISIKEKPSKLEYFAFERFNTDGASLLVSYSSGRVEEIFAQDISVKYQRGEYFLFGDTSVILSYGGAEVTLAVKTKKADYDVSGVVFPEMSVVYDGKAHAPQYSGALPVGLDGIALECYIEKYESEVGKYEIKLVFESKSSNYNSPPPISSTLEITPLSINLIWDAGEFVYDGKAHVPNAYFINENGAKIFVEVSGEATLAGEYAATAYFENENYLVSNAEIKFKILKADYDLSTVFWSKSEFVYDGEEKCVTVSGLPDGVSVVGYTDNKATRAGNYLAKVTLLYDNQNYNEPKIDAFPFTVRRAEYSLDGFSFSSNEAIFDGETHYPLLVGEMPTGIDGCTLRYSFDKGATRVSEGKVKVTVSFSSDSENYNVPKSVEAYVTVKPKGITVEWEKSSFIYTGKLQLPSASAEESEVYVVGGGEDAGVHEVSAFSENSDYYVINSKFSYEILRAENKFTKPLSAEDIYEGDEVKVFAESLSGDVSYRFFADESLTLEVENLNRAGIYYAVAESAGGKNYSAIRSEAVSFTVTELVPVAIHPEIIITSPRAFSKLSEYDFIVVLEYNSGKYESVSFEDVEIEYQNGDSLRVKDSEVTFLAFGMEKTVPIAVSFAEYDTSEIFWSDGNFVYDGEEKSIFLSGLPAGVEVLSYDGNERTESGTYSVIATLSYDSENYLAPSIPAGELTIEKAKLPTPVVLPMKYSGEFSEIETENSDFCKYSKILYRDSGKYSVLFEVVDSANFVFLETLDASVEVEFEILPCDVTVKISDITLFLFEEEKEVTYELVGEVFEGDDLMLEFVFGEDSVACISGNSNYRISVEGGKITRKNYPSPEGFALIFLFILLLVILTLIIISLVFHKDRLRRLCVLSRNTKRSTASLSAYYPPRLSAPEKSYAEANSQNVALQPKSIINSEKADELLSDGMAKNLIKHSPSVKTFGRKRGIVNVGELNTAFSSGERVDINRMKSKGIVPYDTAYIKVLADGVLDKSLSVYANDFSITAVKMIALMGGEAVKVNTVRVKMPNDFKN